MSYFFSRIGGGGRDKLPSSFLPSGLDLGRTSVVTTSSVVERSVFPEIIILTSLSDNDGMESISTINIFMMPLNHSRDFVDILKIFWTIQTGDIDIHYFSKILTTWLTPTTELR